jgi:hypothetical protein
VSSPRKLACPAHKARFINAEKVHVAGFSQWCGGICVVIVSLTLWLWAIVFVGGQARAEGLTSEECRKIVDSLRDEELMTPGLLDEVMMHYHDTNAMKMPVQPFWAVLSILIQGVNGAVYAGVHTGSAKKLSAGAFSKKPLLKRRTLRARAVLIGLNSSLWREK